MKRVLTFLIGAVIAGLALTLATTLYGLTLPREHLVMRRTTLGQTPAEVWRVVTDYARQPQWDPDVVRAERVPEGAAAGPLAGALAGARGAGRVLEERSRGDAETQEAIRGAGPEHEPRAPQPEQEPAPPVWRFIREHGRSVLMQAQRAEPPHRLLRSFREEGGRYEGSWDLVIETVQGTGPGRSQVTLTERGRIPNPLRRAVTRLLIGQDRNAVRYLRGLARHFGEEPRVTRVPREHAQPLD